MENKNNAVTTTQERNITDNVLNRVKQLSSKGDLVVPKNYSAENALKSAYLILSETVDKDKKPVLQSCSKESIANTLLDMVIQGLSPAKKQCYFIPYSGKLQLSRSYMGTVAVTKRLNGVKNVVANCIYEGDEFEYKLDLNTGEKVITKHEQKFENIDNAKIKGAYAIVITEDYIPNHVEIMNINQIEKAWSQRRGPAKSDTHIKFAEEMAKKTVINRACKMFANTSDDSDILVEAFNNSDKAYEQNEDTKIEVIEEIKEKANEKEIDIDTKIDTKEVVEAQVKEEEKEVIEGQISALDSPGF